MRLPAHSAGNGDGAPVQADGVVHVVVGGQRVAGHFPVGGHGLLVPGAVVKAGGGEGVEDRGRVLIGFFLGRVPGSFAAVFGDEDLEIAERRPVRAGVLEHEHAHEAHVGGLERDGAVANARRGAGVGQGLPRAVLEPTLDAAFIAVVGVFPDELHAGDVPDFSEVGFQPLREAASAGAPARVVGVVEGVLRGMFHLTAGGGDAGDGGVGAHELSGVDVAVGELKAPGAGHGQVPRVVGAQLVRGHRRGLRQGQGQRGGRDTPGVLSEGGSYARKQKRGEEKSGTRWFHAGEWGWQQVGGRSAWRRENGCQT